VENVACNQTLQCRGEQRGERMALREIRPYISTVSLSSVSAKHELFEKISVSINFKKSPGLLKVPC
jgi:hypothetical protein